MRDFISSFIIGFLIIIVAYFSFAFSFSVANWDASFLDPRVWGWMEFRIGALLVLATLTAKL
jgi:hypothetical protein